MKKPCLNVCIGGAIESYSSITKIKVMLGLCSPSCHLAARAGKPAQKCTMCMYDVECLSVDDQTTASCVSKASCRGCVVLN